MEPEREGLFWVSPHEGIALLAKVLALVEESRGHTQKGHVEKFLKCF